MKIEYIAIIRDLLQAWKQGIFHEINNKLTRTTVLANIQTLNLFDQ